MTMPDAKPKGLDCPECRSLRPHYVRPSETKGGNGQVVRVLACSACEAERPIPPAEAPGIVCPNPKCRDTRFRTVYTRHRKSATVRVKRCVGCGRRIRTCERVESFAA